MKVQDLMTRDVVTAQADWNIGRIAELMAQKNVGSVIITENRRCIGLVTDRHVAVKVVGKGKDPKAVNARDVMTATPVCCREDDTVFEAAQKCFKEGPFRRLPVLNKNDELVGVLSIADLALAAHPLLEAVLAETEASVNEAKVQKLDIKRQLREQVPAAAR